MSKINKSVRQARLLSEHARLFRCPLCAQPMSLVQEKSLTCSRKHCFDLSSKGYINFLSQSHKTKYGKILFASRKKLCQYGAFDPLIDGIVSALSEEVRNAGDRQMKLLDAGCGEGSHLAILQKRIDEQAERPALGIGLDMAKEGILMAAKQCAHALWCVADLAQIPLADKRIDIVLNILSPSNYGEFRRVLRNDGTLVKIVPGSGHLRELRELLHLQTSGKSYSNNAVLERFDTHFERVALQHIRYGIRMERDELEALIRMTPLTWDVPEESIQQALNGRPKEITFDFSILLGKKR